MLIPKCATNNQADYEVELAIVIGKTGKDIKEADVGKHVAAYTVGELIRDRFLQTRVAQTSLLSSKRHLGPKMARQSAIKPMDIRQILRHLVPNRAAARFLFPPRFQQARAPNDFERETDAGRKYE